MDDDGDDDGDDDDGVDGDADGGDGDDDDDDDDDDGRDVGRRTPQVCKMLQGGHGRGEGMQTHMYVDLRRTNGTQHTNNDLLWTNAKQTKSALKSYDYVFPSPQNPLTRALGITAGDCPSFPTE